MRIALVVSLSLWSAIAAAQAPIGIVDDPCGPPLVAPPVVEQTTDTFVEPGKFDEDVLSKAWQQPEALAYNKERSERAARDWPNLCRYRADNAGVLASKTPTRVVFMGDSITEFWVKADPELFSKGVVGRGISGQTTPQMLLRFRADVVALQPKIVHIMAGTNDIAGNTGPLSVESYQNNIIAMTEIARTNGIKVILASIPPADRFFWQPAVEPIPRIMQLNRWLREYAKQIGAGYVDYYGALVGKDGELKADLANDGVHPNKHGYALMRPLVLAAIAAQKR